jgi:glycosyltransferase involved in cell wall biosynthesis
MEGLVSIIIPYYNRGYIFKDTLDSILKQTYTNWEAVIVDDGSTREELNILNGLIVNDNRVKLLQRTTGTKGPSACRNIGIKASAGKYLLFLDSDDIITADCLYNRINYMQQNVVLDFAVFTQGQFKNTIGDNEKVFSKFFDTKEEYLKNFISDAHPWQTSAPIWKKSSIEKIGGFREDYTIMEDPELHIRALLAGLKFEVIKGNPDFYYRITDKTQEQETFFWRQSILGRIKFFEDIQLLLQQQGVFEKYKKALSKGYMDFMKYFLLARSAAYPKEFTQINKWAKKYQLVSFYKLSLIYLFAFINKHPKTIGLVLRKGSVYKLI